MEIISFINVFFDKDRAIRCLVVSCSKIDFQSFNKRNRSKNTGASNAKVRRPFIGKRTHQQQLSKNWQLAGQDHWLLVQPQKSLSNGPLQACAASQETPQLVNLQPKEQMKGNPLVTGTVQLTHEQERLRKIIVLQPLINSQIRHWASLAQTLIAFSASLGTSHTLCALTTKSPVDLYLHLWIRNRNSFLDLLSVYKKHEIVQWEKKDEERSWGLKNT